MVSNADPKRSSASSALSAGAVALHPTEIWIPDTRSPEFIAEAHRQSAVVAASEHEAEDQAFVDAISIFFDE